MSNKFNHYNIDASYCTKKEKGHLTVKTEKNINDDCKNLKTLVSCCFGDMDALFALHPSEKNYANQLKKKIKKDEVTLSEARQTALEHLEQERCSPAHIDEQLNCWDKFFRSAVI